MIGKVKWIGNVAVQVSQTMNGWNVSSWEMVGKKPKTYRSVNTRTRAQADQEFTRQVALVRGTTPRTTSRKTATKRTTSRTTSRTTAPKRKVNNIGMFSNYRIF